MTAKIITSHAYPPIPDRRFDWCAHRDGEEENGHTFGWGSTEQEAIEDMLRLERECAECEEDEIIIITRAEFEP